MIGLSYEALDSTSTKVFWYASEELNFTKTAELIGATQSGVSQHIKRLEIYFGVKLFKRIGKILFLTSEGEILKEYLKKNFEELEKTKEKINLEQGNMKGLVSYSMPESCLHSPHFKLLLKEKIKICPKVSLKVEIKSNDEIIKMIEENQVDFGFITKKVKNNLVNYIPFCKEEYILVGHKSLGISSLEKLKSAHFISHPDFKEFFLEWQNKGKVSQKINFKKLKILNQFNCINGVKKMLVGGLGVTILPYHCVETLIKKKILKEYNNFNCDKILNQIYMAQLKDIDQAKRVKTIQDIFMKIVNSPKV